MGMRSMSVNDQVALGSCAAFVVLAVVGFLFVSVTAGVIMLLLAVGWPLFYRSYFDRDGNSKDTDGR